MQRDYELSLPFTFLSLDETCRQHELSFCYEVDDLSHFLLSTPKEITFGILLQFVEYVVCLIFRFPECECLDENVWEKYICMDFRMRRLQLSTNVLY